MNHWLKKHIKKKADCVTIQDNYSPIKLSCVEEYHDEMPILRDNYLELQGIWNIYVAGIEIEGQERYGSRIYS